MKNRILTITIILTTILFSCNEQKPKQSGKLSADGQSSAVAGNPAPALSAGGSGSGLDREEISSLSRNLKTLDPGLPTIGILMFDQVLMTELTAPIDVFSKHSEDGKQLFNVIAIAEDYNLYTSEEGLKMFPDYTLANAPDLDILIVPSAYDMTLQTANKNIVGFIREQNNNTDYTVSNCAGATLIGESGIADGRKIVTWIGGGTDLQKNYPNLKVQDDSKISFIEDGKFMSSNGNLATYISSLELLEKLTSQEHRKFVESHLYLDRLQEWKK
ncbi:MAG TPA: DJ-1/PfpI family protein [Bacteroidales bacterium]|jgi:transcriptional regulator GlxA family with amidase domain|nr:DJ-1/PfpI family protein [Bacteroidales bacterium]